MKVITDETYDFINDNKDWVPDYMKTRNIKPEGCGFEDGLEAGLKDVIEMIDHDQKDEGLRDRVVLAMNYHRRLVKMVCELEGMLSLMKDARLVVVVEGKETELDIKAQIKEAYSLIQEITDNA